MKTTIPVGTWVSYRYRGKTEYAQVVSGPCTFDGPMPPENAMVQPCVWKLGGTLLEPRGKPRKYTGHAKE